jgi:FAD/FMN-containing dehydrogenase
MHANVLLVDSDPGRPDSASPDTTAALREDVYALVCDRFDGSWSAEHGIGPLNADQWLNVTTASTRGAISGYKSVMDPLGILGHPDLPF